MKFLRQLGWAVVGLLGLLVIAVMILLIPAVQRPIAERLLRASVPGEVQLDSIKLRPGSLRIDGLVLGLGPGHLTVAQATARFSLGSLLQGQPRLDELAVDGLLLDLSRPDPSHRPTPLRGVVSEIPPSPFELGTLAVKGRILLATGQPFDLDLSGGNYRKSQVGRIRLLGKLGGANPAQLDFGIELRPGPAGEVAGLAVTGTLTAMAQGTPLEVGVDANFERADGEERTRLSLANAGAPAFLQGNAKVSATRIAGEFTLAIGGPELTLAAHLLGRELPTLSAQGSGAFSLDRQTGALESTLKLDAHASRLDRLAVALAEVPAVQTQIDLALSYDQESGTAKLPRLKVEAQAHGHPFALSVALKQALTWDAATGPGGLPDGDLLDLSVRDLPLAWLAPGRASGRVASGVWKVKASGGEVQLQSASALRIELVALQAADGEVLVRNLVVDLMPSASWRTGALFIDLPSLRISDATHQTVLEVAAQLRGTGDLSLDHLSGWVRGVAHLVRLADQPLAAGIPPSVVQLEAELKPATLPSGPRLATGAFRVSQAGRTSDLSAEATLQAGPAPTVAATLRSSRLHLPDLQAFATWAESLPGGADPATPPSDPVPAPDSPPVAFWAPWRGTLEADFDRVELADSSVRAFTSTLTQVRARARLDDAAIRVDELSALLGGRPLQLQSTLEFAATQRLPYALAGDFRLDQLDLATLAPPSGDRLPFFEGKVTLAGEFSSRAATADQLLTELRFELRGDGTEGRIRPLSGTTEGDPRLGLATALGGLFGGRSGSAATSTTANLSSLLAQFREIPYERFQFKASRSEGPLELSLFELVAAEVRLSTSARIDLQSGLALNQQTFELPVRLAVRGRTAYLLDQGALLTGRQLGQGWYEGPTYIQGGTLSAPRSNLADLFSRALIGALTGRRLGLTDPAAPAAPAPATPPAPTTP